VRQILSVVGWLSEGSGVSVGSESLVVQVVSGSTETVTVSYAGRHHRFLVLGVLGNPPFYAHFPRNYSICSSSCLLYTRLP
jgi:hypothetical protein